jgi:predicted GIY-YIG superfamily endonuclease
MHPRFTSVADSLHPSFEKLLAMVPVIGSPPPLTTPASGVYLFSEGEEHLYVGRSNRLRKRYFLHCRPGSQQNQASFAFRLAREATQQLEASYSKVGGRKQMVLQEGFRGAFDEAKARIRRMSYRFVEETDQTRQALLELYVSIALKTPYNDFNTH